MSVYFIHVNDSAVKIGHAQKPYQRLMNLQAGAVERLKLISCIDGGREQERALHERFAELRIRGEMFRREGALQDYIETLPPPPSPPPRPPRRKAKHSTEDAQRCGSMGGKAKAANFKAELELSVEEMREVWMTAKSNEEAAERTGISARTLHRWFKKSGRKTGRKRQQFKGATDAIIPGSRRVDGVARA